MTASKSELFCLKEDKISGRENIEKKKKSSRILMKKGSKVKEKTGSHKAAKEMMNEYCTFQER